MNQYINFLNDRRVLWTISFFIVAIYFLPYFVKGQNIHAIVYDNLDSNVIWFKLLAESGKIFADSMDIIPNMMNGLPRLSYGSEFNVTLWLYYLFNDFTAYVINDIIVHIFAFVGMVILLSRYIIKQELEYNNLVIFSTALLFALVPFWSNGGLSVASQPLALYAFLNIRSNRDNRWDWIILVLLPFYSSFILAFFFFLFIVGLVFLYDLFKTKKINFKFLFATILMILLYLLVEYRLVYNMIFDSGFVSHRTEFALQIYGFNDCLRKSHFIFLNGQDHNINLHYRYILPIILLALLISLKKETFTRVSSIIIIILFAAFFVLNLWDDLLTKEMSMTLLLLYGLSIWIFNKNKIFPFLLILQIVISLGAGFYYSQWMGSVGDTFPLLHSFHFARFMMLQTLIWYLLLAFSLQVLFQKLKFTLLILLTLMIFQTLLTFEYRNFMRISKGPVTYKTYYASNLYKEIDNFIGKPKSKYRIVNIGIEPAVSLYNGFYTIDGYSTNYALSYKHKFRKIMHTYLNTLEKHHGDAYVFDNWGSKLYIFTGQCSYSAYKKTILKDLPIDLKQLSYLGANYIFSAYAIGDYKSMHLTFLKKFDNNESYWPVYIYEIDKIEQNKESEMQKVSHLYINN